MSASVTDAVFDQCVEESSEGPWRSDEYMYLTTLKVHDDIVVVRTAEPHAQARAESPSLRLHYTTPPNHDWIKWYHTWWDDCRKRHNK
jgi:hypothetical protein